MLQPPSLEATLTFKGRLGRWEFRDWNWRGQESPISWARLHFRINSIMWHMFIYKCTSWAVRGKEMPRQVVTLTICKGISVSPKENCFHLELLETPSFKPAAKLFQPLSRFFFLAASQPSKWVVVDALSSSSYFKPKPKQVETCLVATNRNTSKAICAHMRKHLLINAHIS